MVSVVATTGGGVRSMGLLTRQAHPTGVVPVR
jgi:hypothetical protein